KHADSESDVTRLGILQVGYKRNKNQKYKLTEITDKFPLFLAAKLIWANECEGVAPLQKDYPLLVSLSPAADGVEVGCVSAVPEAGQSSTRPSRKSRTSRPERTGAESHAESLS